MPISRPGGSWLAGTQDQAGFRVYRVYRVYRVHRVHRVYRVHRV